MLKFVHQGGAISYFQNRRFCFDAIEKTSIQAFEDAKLRDDPTLFLEAINRTSQNGSSVLQHAPAVKRDRECVVAAVNPRNMPRKSSSETNASSKLRSKRTGAC